MPIDFRAIRPRKAERDGRARRGVSFGRSGNRRDVSVGMTNQTSKPPLVFYRTGPMPCPYLAGKVERNLFTELRGPSAYELHDNLARAGFRRSHHIVYRPACPDCARCIPVRIVAERFKPTASQRRILNRNQDLKAEELPAEASEEQYELFIGYQQSRHGGGEMAAMTANDYRAMVEDTSVDTKMVEFRDPAGRLVAACLIDCLTDGISAVYSFFDAAEQTRSLGTYIILWLVGRARRQTKAYVYLGYWVGDCAKMSYKTRFHPLEALGTEGWKVMQDPATGFDAKIRRERVD
jgi:arginine-tRNA-protein transferase